MILSLCPKSTRYGVGAFPIRPSVCYYSGTTKLRLRLACALVESIFIAFLNKLTFFAMTRRNDSPESKKDSIFVVAKAMVCVTLRLKAVLIFLLVYLYLINEVVELNICQGFCKIVDNHLISWNIRKLNSSYFYFITNIVVLNINILCLKMQDKIVC